MAAKDTWRMATAEDDGYPLIFRIREHAPSFANKSAFPHLLAVSWQYDRDSNNGMPVQAEVDRMAELEDLLMPAFEDAQAAFLTVIVTGNGVREWQWYARDRETVMKLVNDTLGELKPFPIQISFQNDPEWESYTQFLEIGE